MNKENEAGFREKMERAGAMLTEIANDRTVRPLGSRRTVSVWAPKMPEADNKQPVKVERISGFARDAMLYTAAAFSILEQYRDTMHVITRRVEGTQEEMDMAHDMLVSVYQRVRETIPMEQRMTLQRQVQMCDLTVGVRVPFQVNRRDETGHGFVFSWEQAEALLEASRDHCIACTRTLEQQKDCKLRAALKELPIEGKDHYGIGCDLSLL